MKECPRCLNLLPDTAVDCEHCGAVLDDSIIQRAEGGYPARTPTIIESSDRPRPTPPPSSFRPAPSPPPPLPPSIGGVPPQPASGRRGHTLYVPPAPAPAGPGAGAAPAVPHSQERKVVGILVTYSWKPEGQVFPVREGRNLIGRGEECDIRLPEDPMLSQVNSHVTFRQSFVLGDMVSMSGTDLNGEPVEEQFRPLKNYARIRTGSTHWTFVIVDPVLAARES
jgi:Inner membrane component of T3SS, cytoplasmic domain